MVEIERVSKSFGRVTALRELSLAVHPGELLAVLGPSGCGKTTLLRLVGGYEHPDEGRIRLAGQDVTTEPPERRRAGMVFQSYALFPHLTVLENVAFGLRVRGRPKAERRRRALEALALTGLEGLESRRPAELSGGQQQRVAVARALVLEPEVLLLDEPFANLDRAVRVRLRDELRTLQRRVGVTTIFVTHDQEEAVALADRIAVLNEGRLEQIGPALELCYRPATEFVASFFGAVG